MHASNPKFKRFKGMYGTPNLKDLIACIGHQI